MPSLVEDKDDSDEGEERAIEGEVGFSLVAQKALTTRSLEDDMQHENIFYTCYHVKEKACSLIIDGGSYANIASATMVEKLNLPTTKNL